MSLFSILYQVALHLALVVYLPKMLWMRLRTGKYRESLALRFGYWFPELTKSGGPTFWLHGVSVGEVKALGSLSKKLRDTYPNATIIVSTVTETGNAEAKRTHPSADHVVYLPFDLWWVVRPIVRRVKPDHMILSETDIWYAFLDEAKKHGAWVTVVSGKLSLSSLKRFVNYPWLSRRLLGLVDFVCAQNQLYATRFLEAGMDAKKVDVGGNLKFDSGASALSQADLESWKTQLGIGSEDLVLTVGSTHSPEEKEILDIAERLWERFPQLKLILVPRHPERFQDVAMLLQERGVPFVSLSTSRASGKEKVILVDLMGKLCACYQVSDIAIVAGSFGSLIGGHNVLEPCDYGVPVLFGPHMQAQEELRELVLGAGAGLQVDIEGLELELVRLLQDESERKQLGQSGFELVTALRGSLERTWNLLKINEK